MPAGMGRGHEMSTDTQQGKPPCRPLHWRPHPRRSQPQRRRGRKCWPTSARRACASAAAVAVTPGQPDGRAQRARQQFHYPLASSEGTTCQPELVTLVQPFSRQAERPSRRARSQVTMRLLRPGEPRASARPSSALTVATARPALHRQSGRGRSPSWAAAPCWWTPTCAARASTKSLACPTPQACPRCCPAVPRSRSFRALKACLASSCCPAATSRPTRWS